MTDQQIEKIRDCLAAIRIENTAIGKGLAGVIEAVEEMRASQLGVDLMITELEEKLGK